MERIGKALEGVQVEEDLEETEIVEDLSEWDRERDAGIEEMLENLKELGYLFKDLASLVLEQGTLLDRIDYNIQESVNHSKSAVKELTTVISTQAEKRQRSARAMCCILALIMLIVVLVLALVLKHV